MSGPLRLVLFDVDGTLVDGQHAILAAMDDAFAAIERVVPARERILKTVGLSLDHAMRALDPTLSREEVTHAVASYKSSAFQARMAADPQAHAPLYPGARAAIDALHAIPEVLLGLATGKSQRGLNAVMDAHGLSKVFVTRQVADHHPSKPHPSMILTALSETGVAPENTVMIGDTSYDIEMARAAGVTSIGVDWGYHPDVASQADLRLRDFDDLLPLLSAHWEADE